MADRTHFFHPVQDEQGNALADIQVSVEDTEGQMLASIYTAKQGGSSKDNPFITNGDKTDDFFVGPGKYLVTFTDTQIPARVETRGIYFTANDDVVTIAGDEADVLIVNSDGNTLPRTISGHATIDRLGEITLASGSVDDGVLAASAVDSEHVQPLAIKDGHIESISSEKVGSIPFARIARGANMTISDDTFTPVQFTIARFNFGEMYDGDTSLTRLTAVRDGVHLIIGQLRWANTGSDSGFRIAEILLNGTKTIARDRIAVPHGKPEHNVMTEYYLSAGEYVELIAYQNTGGNRALEPLADNESGVEFSMSWRGN